MTVERYAHVQIPERLLERFSLLRAQVLRASEHLGKEDFGDRTAAVRYEQLLAQLENLAYDAIWDRDVAVVDQPNERTVYITWPFGSGAAAPFADQGGLQQTSTVWRSSDDHASRTKATFERFSSQLAEWANLAGASEQEPGPLSPSGVQNRALTEALREYVPYSPGRTPINARVVYIDGSEARPFPLGSVKMDSVTPNDNREITRMTLMSVRHFDMDHLVDGAWLRNREVSLPRARALTDELVYAQSVEQFVILGANRPVTLHIYQTGLEAANVGFYRALVNYHRERLGYPIAVVPHYFAGENKPYVEGKSWTIL